MKININDECFAYLVGLGQTDGRLEETTRNRGRFSIELSERDKDVLERIQCEILNCGINATLQERVRNTNFKKEYRSCVLQIYDRGFRTYLKKYIPTGKKSDIIQCPNDIKKENIRHYIRGIIDGDGSVGIIKNGKPFISLWIKSKYIAIAFENFCFSITGEHRLIKPTTRDGGYSILYSGEHAQKIIKELYSDCDLYLKRKKEKANIALKWKRPENMPIRPKGIPWTKEEEAFVKTHSVEECLKKLNRSKNSIKIKQCRLRLKENAVLQER